MGGRNSNFSFLPKKKNIKVPRQTLFMFFYSNLIFFCLANFFNHFVFAENDWKKRNCFCDNACAMYGDCCIDANAYVQADQQVNHQSFECANLKQYGDIYVKNKCQPDYLNPTIKAKCETPGLPNNDPFGTTPITSMASGFTYKNYYCAVCNEDSEDVRFWRPRLECPTLTSYSNRFKNISSDFVRDNLVLSEDGQR